MTNLDTDKTLEHYNIDGVSPSDVIHVVTENDVSDALLNCHANGLSVVPWSGGTRMNIGNIPTRYDVALDLSGLRSNIEHVAGDMTVVCDAGVNIGELEALLRAQGQRLPFNVPFPETATIGGSIASNAPNRLRVMFGGLRDWVIGMRVVLADGTSTKSGGRVVKNVQGYDLHRLHTGAYGTLGVITEVGIKLVPLPKATRTVAMWFDQIDLAGQGAVEIGHSQLNVECARLFCGGGVAGMVRDLSSDRYMDASNDLTRSAVLTMVQISGSRASLERQTRELTGLAGTIPALGYEVLDSKSESDAWKYMESPLEHADVDFRARIISKASDTIRIMDGLQRFCQTRGYEDNFSGMTDVGYGTLTISIDKIEDTIANDLASQSIKTSQACGGSALIEKCSIAVKNNLDVFGIDDKVRELMLNMKREYDPNRVLNSGRYAFRI